MEIFKKLIAANFIVFAAAYTAVCAGNDPALEKISQNFMPYDSVAFNYAHTFGDESKFPEKSENFLAVDFKNMRLKSVSNQYFREKPAGEFALKESVSLLFDSGKAKRLFEYRQNGSSVFSETKGRFADVFPGVMWFWTDYIDNSEARPWTARMGDPKISTEGDALVVTAEDGGDKFVFSFDSDSLLYKKMRRISDGGILKEEFTLSGYQNIGGRMFPTILSHRLFKDDGETVWQDNRYTVDPKSVKFDRAEAGDFSLEVPKDATLADFPAKAAKPVCKSEK